MEATKLEIYESVITIFIIAVLIGFLVFGSLSHWDKHCDSNIEDIYEGFCDTNKFCNCENITEVGDFNEICG